MLGALAKGDECNETKRDEIEERGGNSGIEISERESRSVLPPRGEMPP